MVSIFFLFRSCRQTMIAHIFMKSTRKIIWIWRGQKNRDWTWLISIIYDVFHLNQKINRGGQSNPSKLKIQIYYFHNTVYLKCQCVLLNISDIMMHLSRASIWIAFIVQANDDFDKWLDIISFLLWIISFCGFLEGKPFWCQLSMNDIGRWMTKYVLNMHYCVYVLLCWDACLMNHIS